MAKIDLDLIETVDDSTLVTLDDRIHGYEGKYVGKKEVTGNDHEETVYKIYYKGPETALKSILHAFTSKIGRDGAGVKEYPEKVPESALQENVNTSSGYDDPAQPDKKTVLRHKTDNSAPYSDNLGEQEEQTIKTLRQRVEHWKTKAQDAEGEKREAKIESDLEDDTGPDYNPERYRDRVGGRP